MTNHSQQIVQKLWNYCNVLRDGGLSYGDYVEQLALLLFLKMAHERTQPPRPQPSIIPAEFDWPSLKAKSGDPLEVHYRHILETLSKEGGMLGLFFRRAQDKIQDPAKLEPQRLARWCVALRSTHPTSGPTPDFGTMPSEPDR
jgi:type I restriction enzyme M protein